MYTHTRTQATNTAIWKGKNHPKVYSSTNSEEKPQKVLIVESFEGDDEKAQYASFKHIFI